MTSARSNESADVEKNEQNQVAKTVSYGLGLDRSTIYQEIVLHNEGICCYVHWNVLAASKVCLL